MASILLGNVKGPQGDTGATGPKGDTGNAATVQAGSVTTVPYGQNARVTNSGDEHDAIFDFVIPQGRPGEQTTDMQNLTLGSMTEPSTEFPIPAIGETGKVIFGKITKWFSDMTALVATKFNTSNVVNNLTTTSSGYALDARQGRALNSEISTLTQEVSARIKNVGNFGTQYTNVNLLPTNTIGWVNGTGGNISNLPSTSAYHMITVFPLSTHGFQLAIRYNADGMYLRTYAEGTWSAWKNLV